jgi:hypothetical protein
VAFPHLGDQLADFLGRVLQVGVQGDDDIAAACSKPAMMAMCWPALAPNSMTRVTSGRCFELLSAGWRRSGRDYRR